MTLAKVALLVVHKERRWVMFVCCGMMESDKVYKNVRLTLVYVRVNPYQQTYQVICEQVPCRACTGN